jgi:PAS domain S-box-containing protein
MAEALEQRTAEQEQTAEQLRATNETLRAVIEGAPLAIYALDRAGVVRMWNPAAERMFGWSAGEALDRSHPAVPAQAQAEFQATLARHFRGETIVGYETRRQRNDGTLIDVVLSTAPLRDASGAITGVLTLAADVTEQRTLEDQFRRAQKLEAVGQLAGGIAHDFNNLLTVIIGRSQLLLARADIEGRVRRDIDLILTTATRAASLTKRVLAFSRKQVLEPKVLDVTGVVSGIMPMLERLIGEHIELVFRPAPALGRVHADPGQLEQVIVNLVVNARDAMPDGGRLTIETANASLDEDYARRHVGARPGAHVMLSVTDTGVGMDAATQARIFEPFFTTKEPGKGTGLGLATVYGIVKQSGGSIWVYSEVGHGSTFKVYLPQLSHETRDPTEPAVSTAERGTETVLVAEDDDEVRTIARDTLQAYGYTVLEARRPADALLIAERHTGPIRLLVTDVVMPQMSGPKLAERLRGIRRELRVLYMSGYTGETAPLGAAAGAGVGFIAKPFTPDALARKAREILDAPE